GKLPACATSIMEVLKKMWVSFGLLLAIAGIPASAFAEGQAGPALPRHSSGWAVADLDGDRHPDIAVRGDSRADGASYLQEITFRLSGSDGSAITIRTARRAARLTVRDL